MTFNPANTLSPYLPTSIWFPEDFTQFRIKFLQSYRDIANNLNIREIGIFDLQESLTGEQWFTAGDPQKKRGVFRKVFSIGAIAAGVTLNTPHGLTNVTAYTHIYGTAITAVPDNRPIPFASATVVTNQIEIRVDATNIIIVNGATAPNITSGLVVLEFLKN
jgi:hypothetical protein